MRHFFQTLELFWNTFSRRWNFFAAGFLFLLLAAAPASAQLNLNGFLSGTNGTYYTNFSGMGTANSMWTNQNTHPYLAGWYAAKSVTTTTNIAFNADTGSGTVGGMMNYGSASAADRALGSLNSNPTGDLAFAAYFYNDTGATLTNFTVTYTGEQWRCGGSTTRDILEFGYKKSASALTLQATTNATWGGTLVSSLNYTSPYANATAGACNGNASNKLTLTASLNIDLPSGQYLMLRWRDVNISGNDHGISVDDFVLYFQKVESSAPDVEVKGNGVVISDGDTSPSPSDHTDFGAVGLSQSNLVRTFTITNSGTASMGVGNVSAGGDFTIAAQPSSPVSAGATTTFNVQFDPSASGLRTATISFTNTVSGGKQTYTFDVQGTGVLAGIARSPTTINITAMVGTTNANENFGITNVGRGRLDYNLSSNVNWLSVSPVTGQLAETAGQQTTVKFNLAGLSAGTSNATITINSSGASNDGQTVTVALTLTNIPSIATHAVTNDGKELTRVSWVKLGAFDTMVVYRGTNAPSAPTQGTSYGVGGAVGSDGSHVVYKGSGTNFEHVAGTGRTHYYAFYAITNNHYSLAVTGSVATASYGAGEMVDQAAYTNATILHGLAGGAGWTNAWIESNSGSFSNQTTSFSTQTNYPATAANKLLVPPPSDTGRYAYRQFAGFTGGKVYAGYMINIQYNGPNKYSGGSFMDGSTEKMFFGEVYGADQKLGIGGTTSGSNLYAGVGNDYVVIARYDFGTDVGSVVAYKIGTDAVPLSEPSTWHATYTDSSLTRIDGLRIASGAGAGSGTPGNTYFDELRVATNWSELLGVLAAPEIAVLGTNGAVISDGDLAPSAADGTDFGNTTVAVGLTERVFGITNSGSGLLNISGVTTGGAHAADFIVWSYPAIVSPGAISNLVVRFDPAALGGRTGTIVIANDDGDEASYDFAVQGTGVASTQNVTRFQGAEGTTNDNWSFSVNAGYGRVATPNDAQGQTGEYSIRLVGSNASNSDPTVTFDSVDVRGLSNVAVSVAFAASGADTGDDLYLELSYDNGATWGVSSQLVDGLSNYSTNFFGTDPVRTVGSNPFVLAVAATATQVRIRVRFDEAAAGDNRFDEYYVDDVSLLAEGTRPVITFGTGSVVIAEGDAARAIPVTISSAADATVRVYVAGTAQAGGTDFSLSATTIVFAAGGATTSNLTITVVDDVVEEGPELARLTLVDAAGGVIQGADEFLLQIRDSDAFALMTANLVSGTNIVVDVTPYDEPANRMFQLLRPDVVAIQEWTVTNASLRAFVDVNFGTNFHYIVEPESGAFNMPNGVISRWPIVATGEWTDVEVDNRDFAWATIDLPGPKNLHVVSVHFKAGSTGPDITTREAEARALTNYLATAGFPAGDFLVVAGDLNLTGRVENALAVLTNMVSDATRPADQDGDEDTNRGRSAPYDVILPDGELEPEYIAYTFNGETFSSGMIFDSRLFDLHQEPVLTGDPDATNLSHLAVMKVFSLATNDPDIAVLGTNGALIASGDTTPSAADGTDFGSALVSGGTVDMTFSITNSGGGNLTVSGVTTSGAHTADFIVLSYPATVSPGARSNFVVRFDPATSGGRTGVIATASNDGDEGSYTFTVQGVGQTTATVTTTSISSIGTTTAQGGGNVTADGGATVTNRGVVWNTSTGPTLAHFASVTNGGGTGSYTTTLTNLTPGQAYFARAFAQNAAGTSYGNEVTFTAACFSAVVTGLYASATNDVSFTATWSNFAGAAGYALDVSTNAGFAGGAAITELFFSEYVEGSSNNKFLEIYNGTGASVDLADYRVLHFNGGSASVTYSLSLSGTLAAGDVYVIENNSESLGVASDLSTSSQVMTFNGDDAIALTNVAAGGYADIIGQIGTDPGSEWGSGSASTADNTIRRMSSVTAGDTDGTDAFTPSTEWDGYAQDTVSDLGSHTVDSGTPSYVAGYSNRAVAATSATVTGLTSGLTYFFRVRATNDYCVTGNSSTAQVTTVLLTPDVAVYGNGSLINDGDATPSTGDHTDFGVVGLINSNLVRTFTITNGGLGTLSLGNVTTSGAAQADFVMVSQPSSPVSAGGTATFQVRFDPSAVGTRTATLQFTNNVAGKTPYDFVVQGTGVAAGIVRAPSSISVTTMLGSAPAAQNFGVTNGGLGQLVYTVSSNVAWLAVSPVGATLSEGQAQQHTVSFAAAGLGAGVSNGTITLTDGSASNSPQTVDVTWTITNIPNATANLATNDGRELVRVSWTPPPSLEVLIVYRGTNAPSAPSQGVAYTNGQAVGSDGSRVVYKGAGTYLDHLPGLGRTNHYAFYAVNNDCYAPGVTSYAVTATYGADERVEPFAYTNGVSLAGVGGGNLFTSTWSIGAGNFTVLSNGPNPNLAVNTNYPTPVAQRVVASNYVNDTEMRASRRFAPITNGTLYLTYQVAVEYGGAGKYTGVRLLSNTTERVFAGETGGNDVLGIDGHGGGVVNSAFNINSWQSDTGNVYLVVARYIFSSNQVAVKGYYRTTTVPEAEPSSWDATATASGDRTFVDGIELVSGGFSGNQPGLTSFDEIRIATNWAGIVPPSGVPGIGVSPTNITVSVMRGSNPPAQTFGVTNVGAGVLAYSVATNFSWMAVSPVAGTLASAVGQQHTVTVSAASLPVGTNIGTITISDAAASNSPRTVRLNVVVTNIPPPTNVVAMADGYEMVRLGWQPPAGLSSLILHDDNPIATDPSQGLAYSVGDAVGVARVIYAGSGTTLEHIVPEGSTNYYAFYAVNNNYYSSASTNTTTVDCPDPAATNLVAGDIAIFGLNTLTGGGTNNDSFGFVPLIDLPTGTQIKFTDNGWRSNNTFRTGEGTLIWMATSCVPAGTAIRWVSTNVPQVTAGSIINTNGSFEPNIQGEQVLAYQGADTNPVFLYALASHTNATWDVDATDSHSSALPLGLTNGYTAVVIHELNNVVLSTNQLAITGDRAAILSFIGSTNNWVGSDTEIFDLLAYNFTFPDINSSGGGVMTSVVMGVYRTNEIVDAFAYTNGVSMSSPVRGGGHGWTSNWGNVIGTWTSLSNNHPEVSFPTMVDYPTNAANAVKVSNPGVNSTGSMERYFAAVTNGSVYFSTFVAYQYEGIRKFAGISLLSGGVETGFVGKVSDNSHGFTLGVDTFGAAQQFANFDLRGLENSTNNTYLIVGRYDFSTKELRGHAYYRGDTVPTSEPAYWAVTGTVPGAGITLVDGVAIRAGADAGGAIGDAYFDEVRVATSWGGLINRNPPSVETRPVTNLQPTTAVGGGQVTDDGGLTVTNRGVVWTTNGVPTVADSASSDGTGTGLYSSTLTNLTPGQTYYVRAFAQNSAGTAYGGLSNFTAACFTSVVTGLYANPTNSQDFTANWTALPGALGYELDVSSVSNFLGTGGSFGSEPFTNIGGGTVSSYLTRNWTNNGVAWTAYKARTDQTINGSEAIALHEEADAYLVSGTITGGVSALSVKHQRAFAGSTGEFDIFVNSIKVATNVSFGANVGTAVVQNINVSGTFTLMITNSGAERLILDDLAWTNDAGSAGSFVAGYDGRSVAGISQAVTGLTEGAIYYFRVRAVGAGTCASDNSATQVVQTIDTLGPALTNFGVNVFTNTTITDYQLANAITVLVTAVDGGGVNWNGASVTAPNISPFFSITNPLGAGIVSPVAFASAGHVDGESPSVMTGVVTASAVTTGLNFRAYITVADHSFTNTSSYTNFFTVIDDDDAAPTVSSADITYGGTGSRYFSITTNASPVLVGDRAGTFLDVRYTLTDADLNEAAARDLRFAFGARDATSGIVRGTAGTTNTVMSFSVESVISGNFTNYRSDLSSANYTNQRTTNVWSFPSGFFTETMINTLMAAASNRVTLTVPDDDSDRAADGAVLYDQTVGWITAVDDDTAGPVLGGLSINGLTGSGVSNVFVETMGTSGSSGDSIATHESNNRFDNDTPTMSGSGDMRNTSTSSGSDYGEASGSFNVMLNSAGETFQIAGIDVSAYSSLTLAFGVRKSATAEDGSGLTVQVSSNGSNWVTLTIPALPTGTGTATWYGRTNTAGTIPSVTGLYVRFSSSNTVEWRVDDVRLIATLSQVQLTDGDLAAGGYAVTSLVQDAFSGVTVSNAYHPYFVLFNTNGAAVVSNGFRTGFADGSTSQQVLATNAAAALSTNLITLGTNTLRVYATDTDNDRSNDRASSNSTPLAVLVVDDDTNAPAVSGFQLFGGITNFDLSSGTIALTGVVADASGIQSGPSYALLLDAAGAVAQSNALYQGPGSSATSTLSSAGLSCGQIYTVRLFAADADLDRPADHLAVTSVALVIQTTGVGGPSDYPLASNLLVNGAAAAPAVTVQDATIRTGGWNLAMALSHPVGVFTNQTAPAFRVTNQAAEVVALTPWSNGVLSGTTYYFTNNALPGAAFAVVATGLHHVVWSASNQGSCVASIVDREVITGGTNVFTVVDDDEAGPVLSGFAIEGGSVTLSVAAASSGFSVTGLVQDAGSGVAFTSQPPYFLFYDLVGGVLASNAVIGGTEGTGTSAVALTNWISGLTLSCGNSYTLRVFAADADHDRASDRTATTTAVLTVVTEGASGDAPAAQDFYVNNTPASSATLFDEQIATGGWRAALVMSHSSGIIVTNGANAPSFLVQNSSGTHVYATSPLTWSNITKSGSTYYATNVPMPGGLTNQITTGTYSLVWSAQSDGLCFGATNGSSRVSPGTNRFLVVDDDTVPPNLYGISVAGGTGSGGGPGAGDCPDPTATNLAAGDIAIFAMNTKTQGSSPVTNNDSFAFVTLVDIPTGTRIKFTDNGWKSSTASFRTGEGVLTWMATSCVPAGTVVRWIATNSAQVNVGQLISTNGPFAPNIEGEQILAYQGSDSSPNFIYAVNDRLNGIWDVDAVDTHSSAIPPGLIDGYTAVAVGEYDNIIINTNNLTITGDREQILYYIGDKDNWIGHDTNVFDLLQFTFTFPGANAGGGTITDADILQGGWAITGLVQDVGSGLMVSNNAGLRYVVMNTNDGQVVSNYFATTFTNGSKTLNAFSNGVAAGTYDYIQLGTYTAQLFAADVDNDRPVDLLERNTNVPFTVVDDDTDFPQIGAFYINGQTTITNAAELTSVVLSGQVRDVTSGIGFTSAPPAFAILDSTGGVALAGTFTYGPSAEGAGVGWTNIWTTNLNLTGIADCGTYTVRVTVADADHDRPGDARSTNINFLISVASGSGDAPVASNLLVNATPAGSATLSDGVVATGGWTLAVSMKHPSGVRIDPPDTPRFILRNAAEVGVVTQSWSNIVTAGSVIYATNDPMPAVAYGSLDTGYYTVVWSARSQGSCFGETNDSSYVDGGTNRFLVYDDDVVAPPTPTGVATLAATWTNLPTVTVTWFTGHVTDVSGVPGFRVTTNHLVPSNLTDGVAVSFTNQYAITNLAEGVFTNWVFAYDGDNDRVDDAARGALTGFVTYIDRTAPTQMTAVAASPGANDNTSEIDLNWAPLDDAGNTNLSPWYSYVIYYTEGATGPTITDAFISVANGPAALGTNTTSGLTLEGLTFDTTYRLALAGVDRAGNVGPLSATQVVTLGSFIVTQGLISVTAGSTNPYVEVSWTAATNKEYDAIYVDASSFADGLTSAWSYLRTVTNSWMDDTGSLARTPPAFLGGSTMRFYRAAQAGRWVVTAMPTRVASREVYVAKPVLLNEGQNFVSLFMEPDSNSVAQILGTNLLPAGPSLAVTSTVISFYGSTTNGQARPVTWWLSNMGHWMYSTGGVADHEPLPLYDGFNVTIPEGAGNRRVVVAGRVPTSTVVRSVGPGWSTQNVYHVLSYNVPRRMKISELGLKEAGLVGHNNGALADEVRILSKGWGSPTNQPKARLRLRSDGTTWQYYSYSPAEFPSGPPGAADYVIEPDEAIIVVRRNSTALSWTNKLYYTPPTRTMTP